jgi:hypothetical protein
MQKPNENGVYEAEITEELARRGRAYAAIDLCQCEDGLYRYAPPPLPPGRLPPTDYAPFDDDSLKQPIFGESRRYLMPILIMVGLFIWAVGHH